MKNWERYIALHKINCGITAFNSTSLDLCVVIPCLDEPDVETTLKSLDACTSAKGSVAVIVVVNAGEQCTTDVIARNRDTYAKLVEAMNCVRYQSFRLIPLYYENLPRKHAGAGYARKLGMDYAIWLFKSVQNKAGIIVALDADCTVEPNFLCEIESAYANDSNLGCTTQYFEHPLNDNLTQQAIVLYELYLRYFRWALVYTRFPYPIHTVGSCFSIAANVYVNCGGMNRRQAGEDFYFLHKVVPNTGFRELNSTTVYPSSRSSHRVPFGTGASVGQLISAKAEYLVYNPECFIALKAFFDLIPSFYTAQEADISMDINKLHPAVMQFIEQGSWVDQIVEVQRNSASLKAFTKRFYQKMDAFKVVKFLNESHQIFFRKVSVLSACEHLCKIMGINIQHESAISLLAEMRKKDKAGVWIDV